MKPRAETQALCIFSIQTLTPLRLNDASSKDAFLTVQRYSYPLGK